MLNTRIMNGWTGTAERRQLSYALDGWRLCSALIGPIVFVFEPSLITAMTQVQHIDQYNDVCRDPAVLCILHSALRGTTVTNHRSSIDPWVFGSRPVDIYHLHREQQVWKCRRFLYVIKEIRDGRVIHKARLSCQTLNVWQDDFFLHVTVGSWDLN